MMRNSTRKIISAMRMSVDGYIEDPEGRQDWVDSWEDEYELLDHVDTCVLGSVMYPGYEQYWTSALDPTGNCRTATNCQQPKKSNTHSGLPKHLTLSFLASR
jgi:hypothetical protein